MRRGSLSTLTLAFLLLFGGTQYVIAACMPTFTSLAGGYVPFTAITQIIGPNNAGDSLVVGTMTQQAFQNLNTVPLPNAINQRFCTTVPLAPAAMYFGYVPTAAERLGQFTAFNITFSPPTGDGGQFGWRIPAGRKIFVSTVGGSQILSVDGNSGAGTVISNGPEGSFNPFGIAIGADHKIYAADSVSGDIWRMDQNGANLENVYDFASCVASENAVCPETPEGPSFMTNANPDLYFNTAHGDSGAYKITGVATTPVGGAFNSPTLVIPAVCGTSSNFCTGGAFGIGTGFDNAGNFLIVNQTLLGDDSHGDIVSLAPPFTSSSVLTTLRAPLSVALNQSTGQLFVSDPGSQQILQIAAGGTTTTYYSFAPLGCEFCPDLPNYIQFDDSGHLYVVTTDLTSHNGKVWRIDPSSPLNASPAATLLVDLNAAFNSENAVIPGLANDEAGGLALETQTVILTFSPSATPETQIATVGNPTDPAAQSLALTVASVLQPFQVIVEFLYEPTDLSTQSHGIGIADGICEVGATAQTDFDCRLAQDFTYQTLGNGDKVVPHIIPSHNNLGVWVRVTTAALPNVDYSGPVQWYYAWNANPSLNPVPGSEYAFGWNNLNPQFFDRPGENVAIDFVANITSYTKFNCNPTCVGTADPGIGGKTPTFNDVVAADIPNPRTGQADVVERLVPVPGVSLFSYFAGFPMLVAFELEKTGTEIPDPTALTFPHSVSAAVLDPATGLPVAVPTFPGFPTTFTYNPFFKLYYIFLSPAPLTPGKTYQLQINSDLFPKPVNANIVVRKSFF